MYVLVKGSIFLKNRYILFKKGLINCYRVLIDRKMCHLKASKISVSLSFLNWIKNEMIFYRATLSQRYDKKIISFQERETLKLYRLSCAIFYDCINTVYQFIKSFLDNKISIFEECGAFK